jgi:hypothetical protein
VPEAVAKVKGSYTGAYLQPVLTDERAVGHSTISESTMQAMERENMRVLEDLAKGERVTIEA